MTTETIHIGITGSRHGCTPTQWVGLVHELAKGIRRDVCFHHGDCVGVDAEAHQIAVRFGFTIVVHPPVVPMFRAYTSADERLREKPYLARNYDIVQAVRLLIVVPSGPEADNPRSGTWATYRMAVKAGVETAVIMP